MRLRIRHIRGETGKMRLSEGETDNYCLSVNYLIDRQAETETETIKRMEIVRDGNGRKF